MPFIPNTDADRKEMLEKIGVSSFDELISGIVPKEIRLNRELNLLPQLSEFEVVRLLESYAAKNSNAFTHVCFMGGGAYDHYTPAIVGSVLERPEFKTAYTPYQAEVSQGTLQAMYEFQSMICSLTGMDVANASMYDGATALAEACLLANAQTRKNEILFAGTLDPTYYKVISTICAGRGLTFKSIVADDGSCDIDALKAAISEQTAGVIVQHPNAYGTLEDVYEIEKVVRTTKAMYIVSVNPVSLGLLEAPAAYNADVVVGEAQSLGIPLNYGGPYLGIFAVKNEFLRKMPGRIAGVTEDEEGKRGFVLTLQTREQQIKREKATSNICTNQGLFMLAATVYMEAMGKQGIKEVAEQSFQKAHYLAKRITEIPGFSLAIDKPFFNEFLISAPISAAQILKEAEQNGILAGIDTSRFPGYVKGLLIAVTEKRTKKEMDNFVNFLTKFSK